MTSVLILLFSFLWHAHNPSSWKLNDGFVTRSLFRRRHASIHSRVMPITICWSTFQTVGSRSLSSIDKGNPTNSTHSRREYWAFFRHCLSIDGICFDRILFTFLTTETSDSSVWKFSFKRLISAVSEAIIVLAFSWVLRNKSIIWFLFNALNVSSVYTTAFWVIFTRVVFSEIKFLISQCNWIYFLWLQ